MPAELDAPTRVRLLARQVVRDGAAEDEFAGRETEIAMFLTRSSGRYATTLRVLERVVPPRSQLLELGADPWLLTQLLLEAGYEVVSAGQRRGVWRDDETLASPQRIDLAWGGRTATLEHHLFDVERDRWPFPDASLHCILCTEVLEHLVYSPAHLFYEAARVLADGGILVVTTPNVLAAENLVALLRGRNVYHPYSGYGAGGRHNREFTAPELRAALAVAGFESDVRTLNVVGYEPDGLLARALRALPARRDHLFAVARKVAPPRLEFVHGLYRSVDRERMRAEGVLFPDE